LSEIQGLFKAGLEFKAGAGTLSYSELVQALFVMYSKDRKDSRKASTFKNFWKIANYFS